MKTVLGKIPVLLSCFFLSVISINTVCADVPGGTSASEQTEDFSDDLNSLFDDASDTGAIVTEKKEDAALSDANSKRGIVLNGNLDTRLGGYMWFSPYDVSPGALFESTVSFSSHPIDSFSIKGSLLVSFPSMQLGMYELYFTYSIFDFAFITAGKKEISWGNSRMFDTNILDDTFDYEYTADDILYDDKIDLDNSKFTVMMSIPFWRFNLIGLVTHFNYKGIPWKDYDMSTEIIRDLSYAAKLEANLWNFSVDIFWKYWADNDKGFDPAFGADLNFQLGDFHFYAQVFTHMNNRQSPIVFPRTKGTASLWWYTQEKVNLGFCLEYQYVYDWYGYGSSEPLEPSEYFKQYLAFEGAWGRIGGSKFTLVLKYMHDFFEKKGTVIPGVKVHDLFPCADLDFGIPIEYGSDFNIGLALELRLKIDF